MGEGYILVLCTVWLCVDLCIPLGSYTSAEVNYAWHMYCMTEVGKVVCMGMTLIYILASQKAHINHGEGGRS